MDIEYYRNYCLEKIGVTEEFPFDKTTLVFKVYGKIFALFDIDNFESVNLKCDPEKAILLREQFNEIKPGYHMNKKHWNTVSFSNNISDNLIIQLTDDSYNLVLNSIPKKLLNSL
ncbi:MAG: MmcQ/YjbR family DNA-binding protein [Bacteroidia bacterium]|nr:MmcQ/YjbR family DNA-binding protein [Bacteroidia bacterium]